MQQGRGGWGRKPFSPTNSTRSCSQPCPTEKNTVDTFCAMLIISIPLVLLASPKSSGNSRNPLSTNSSAFTLIELMVTISIAAALIVAALFFYFSIIPWAQNTVDKHTYTILNDTLTRYKTEGGGVNGLTAGASVNRVISQMQTAITWCGIRHQFLDLGVTYHGRSIGSTGTGAQYHFSRFNSYSDGSGQNNSTSGGSWPAFVGILGTTPCYSLDGINWTPSPSTLTASPQSIAYGGGKFVAIVPSSTSSFYSTDGINWTASPTGLPSSTPYWSSLAYGNGMFVAVATGSTASAYSTDGVNWTASPSGLPFSLGVSSSAVAYGNGMFVAVCNSNASAYSTDGIHWTASPSGLPSGTSGRSIVYGNGVFVTIYGGLFSCGAAYSTDGIHWTASPTGLPTSSTKQWDGLSYGNGVFAISTLASGKSAYSTDGMNWTSGPGMPSTDAWRSMAYGNGMFVAAAFPTTATAYSTDGIHWSGGNATPSGVIYHGLAAVH